MKKAKIAFIVNKGNKLQQRIFNAMQQELFSI